MNVKNSIPDSVDFLIECGCPLNTSDIQKYEDSKEKEALDMSSDDSLVSTEESLLPVEATPPLLQQQCRSTLWKHVYTNTLSRNTYENLRFLPEKMIRYIYYCGINR